jgi:hypothetical protein
MLKFLTDRHAIEPLVRKLTAVLQGGHQVWVVGYRVFRTTPPTGPYFQEAPDPEYGWRIVNYQLSWRDEVLYSLYRNSSGALWVSIPADRAVSHYEDVSLLLVEGNKKSH